MEHRHERVLSHDGCKGCKYITNDDDQFPCSHCRGTVTPSSPFYQKCADLYEPTTTQANPYWERICELSEKQRAKGMKKYGHGLENNPAAMQKRIEHLQEELIDALMYCEWMKDGLKND